jgi:dipeptidyl aminopeptidase/acylaminoacyl peptidase
VAPRPLLIIHGEQDRRLPPDCSRYVYRIAGEPKELVILPGARHSLRQGREELRRLLRRWLVEKLRPRPGDEGRAPHT